MSLPDNSRQWEMEMCDLGAGERCLLPHLGPQHLNCSAWQPRPGNTEATWRCPHPQLPEVLLSASLGTQDPGGLRCDNRYQRLLEAYLAASGGLLEVAVINL